MYGHFFNKIKEKHPLLNCITNYVTINDVANIILACGGSPVMVDAPEEAAEMTMLSNGLLINIGNINSQTSKAMLLAGKAANEKGIPVVLDPVGAGATNYRNETLALLLDEIKFAAIKGNSTEIKTLAGISIGSRGVDALPGDTVSSDICKSLAQKYGAVVIATGATDIISDGMRSFAVGNGRPEMEKITGTGCQLGGLLGAAIAASPEYPLEASLDAVLAMGIAGEIAWKQMPPHSGNSTYRNCIIDTICNLDANKIKELAKISES